MTTTLPSGVDALAYVHPDALTVRNDQYGPRAPDHEFNFYWNAGTQMPGGNALAILITGGSWKANDKTTFAESSGGSGPWGYQWAGYLLNSAVQGTDRVLFNVASLDYGRKAREGFAHSASSLLYEEWYSALGPGSVKIGVKGLPRHLTSSIDDVQRAVQHFKRNAAYYGINPAKIILIGHSVGSNTALGAAFTPSRGWNPNDPSEFAAHDPAKVLGVVNMAGEVDLDTNELFLRHAMYCAGLLQTDKTITGVRADIQRLFLEPNASGLFPTGSTKTAICKALSPIDTIAAAPTDRGVTRVWSYYWKDHNNVGPYAPPGTFENPVGGPFGDYSVEPPHDAAGHFYTQWQRIQDACASKDTARGDGLKMARTAAGVSLGRVLDAANFYPTVQTNSILASLDFMVQNAYPTICDVIEALP